MKIWKKILIINIIAMICLYICFNNYTSKAATYNQTIGDANSSNKNGINLFPDSYKTLLTKLVNKTGHTNWKFRPLNTDIDWNELVTNETNCGHNTIYKSSRLSYPSSWYHSCGKAIDINYYCASKDITSYYMDPRNFLTETTIFQFLDLSNKSNISVAQIKEAVQGTYLAGSVNGESYAQMIYEAAQASGESAFSIVVRIFQELGNGKELPEMISGKNSKYPGVYNFFNYGATDGEGNRERGLAYAKNAGWTTPKKALVEGAKLVAGNYTKSGQVNKYLFKFDVVGSEKNQLYTHQYMTNIQDSNTQASNLYKTYDQSDLLDKSLTFIIPVYKNMPSYVKLPNSENKNSTLYYVSSNYDSVNFRSSPGGTIIGSLRKDTVVTMLQENVNGYGKISCNGQVGYMSMQYLTKLSSGSNNNNTNTSTDTGVKYLGGSKDSNALISYSAQLQDIGWTNWGKNGETIGTTAASKRLETIKISLGNSIKNQKVQYRAHVQDYGWMNWVSEDQLAGTVGESKRLEAIQIKLANGTEYNVKYRVHVQDIGWMGWVSNGETAGTEGKSKRIEAIEIKLEKKPDLKISYQTHVQDIDWMNWASNGTMAGTTGKSKRLEAIKIKLEGTNANIANAIQYRVHVQDIGWMNWVSNGAMAGTTGRSKRLEAIQIKLNSQFGRSVKYRVHVQDIGWMNWVSNGATAGTEGQSKRLEAIEIKVE